jgi:hypothetical protein
MDLDLGGLWSWTVPLWGLFAIVFFLGGILTSPVTLPSLDRVLSPEVVSVPMRGGGSHSGSKKQRA